ncbi:hypothetical protein AMAG_18453 [Allomyces macrogynus ATCC 38327]|uniref:Uncharacterized protein n=1 Tax=Allomyces macrogynus (strain ATCC 38327) TaxID=578462 RepID=A0A0L0SC26_ALLM3|nr:hypothetical protein AMAG_18453 [Allomyces macrogynus ATCC 38327]|eukprot:KNE59982.1 hypothetical protein AMAG_18453 [Allomyces macrogynus ATCC 38327]
MAAAARLASRLFSSAAAKWTGGQVVPGAESSPASHSASLPGIDDDLALHLPSTLTSLSTESLAVFTASVASLLWHAPPIPPAAPASLATRHATSPHLAQATPAVGTWLLTRLTGQGGRTRSRIAVPVVLAPRIDATLPGAFPTLQDADLAPLLAATSQPSVAPVAATVPAAMPALKVAPGLRAALSSVSSSPAAARQQNRMRTSSHRTIPGMVLQMLASQTPLALAAGTTGWPLADVSGAGAMAHHQNHPWGSASDVTLVPGHLVASYPEPAAWSTTVSASLVPVSSHVPAPVVPPGWTNPTTAASSASAVAPGVMSAALHHYHAMVGHASAMPVVPTLSVAATVAPVVPSVPAAYAYTYPCAAPGSL